MSSEQNSADISPEKDDSEISSPNEESVQKISEPKSPLLNLNKDESKMDSENIESVMTPPTENKDKGDEEIDKKLEDILLNEKGDDLEINSDNQDDDLKLRWEDDELDEDPIVNEAALLDDGDDMEVSDQMADKSEPKSEVTETAIEANNEIINKASDSLPTKSQIQSQNEDEVLNESDENEDNINTEEQMNIINDNEAKETAAPSICTPTVEKDSEKSKHNVKSDISKEDQGIAVDPNLLKEKDKIEDPPEKKDKETVTSSKISSLVETDSRKIEKEEIMSTEYQDDDLEGLDSKVNESAISFSDTLLSTPKHTHNLKKPDMMLEIPTQELIEFSDDEEGLTSNLEMSPDPDIEDLDDENKNIDSNDVASNLKDNHSISFLDTEVSNPADMDMNKVKNDIEKALESLENAESSEKVEKANVKDKLENEDVEMASPVIDPEAESAAEFLTREMNETDTDKLILSDDEKIEDICPESDIIEIDEDTDKIERETKVFLDDKEINTKTDEDSSVNKIKIDTVKTTELKNITEKTLQNKSEQAKSIKNTIVDETLDPESKTSTNLSEIPKDTSLVISVGDKLDKSEFEDPQPSTSKACSESHKDPAEQSMFGSSMVQDSSNDVPEMTDSLGLLAESSRVMEEDEEQDDEDDDDHDNDNDNDDDFEPEDESSNQVSADQSEDSNAQQSESDVKGPETASQNKHFNFEIANVSADADDVEKKMQVDAQTDEKKNEDSKENKDNASTEAKESMDVDTVKLSDSDTDTDPEKKQSILKSLLLDSDSKSSRKSSTDSITFEKPYVKDSQDTKRSNVMTYVDLEGSSSEDDVQISKKNEAKMVTEESSLSTSIDIDMSVKEEDTSVCDEEKQTTPKKVTKLNTSEVSITLGAKAGPKLVIPEAKSKPAIGLEVFTLDSDEEDAPEKPNEEIVLEEPPKETPFRPSVKCINKSCPGDACADYMLADSTAMCYYEADQKKRGYVCRVCWEALDQRNRELIEGIKGFTPLLELNAGRKSEDLVEISDSDSDDEPEPGDDQKQLIGAEGAKFLEEKLADMINETWEKYKMDSRLVESQKVLQEEMDRLQKESAEINQMLNDCQVATDNLRNDLYATFEPEIKELPPFVIYDVPTCSYFCNEPGAEVPIRHNKRRMSSASETAAKKPALPEGSDQNKDKEEKIDDDNTEVSVVKLSAEAAPADLPPPGEITRSPLRVGMTVFAMKNNQGSWLKAKITECLPKVGSYSICRLRFEHRLPTKSMTKTLPARCIAYEHPPDKRMTIGTRVIALFKEGDRRAAYYSGIVAEIPNPVNNYRYLIFFDDGYAQYAPHSQTRLVCECSPLVWEEVHPFSREFVRQYLVAYPERPMVRLHAGQNLKTEWRGTWWASRVITVDASLVQVKFLHNDRREWIYRGSTRLAPLFLELQAAERHRPRALPRTQPQSRTNMPYVEYTRSDEQATKQTDNQTAQQQHQNEEIRRQRAVAKKSTASSQPIPQSTNANLDNVTSRVVYYTPKNAVKPYKMTTHTCGPKCKRTDVLALKDLRTYNPLAKPLLSGWERQIVRFKGHKEVMYVAPCGRRLRNMRELHRYLRLTKSDMPVDLFDFAPATHCLAEFVLNKCFVGKKDLSHGKENVPVPCVNYYDESLPEFCSYNTERTPTAGVPLNLDPEFLCGCDCEDDCEDKTKCACWKLTLEGARTIGIEGGNIGYVYRRLPEPLPSGIYECNSRCKCKQTCLNRVAQHPLQLKLQVFKTLNRGWGIRALNDVPKGSFLCVYAGNLLTDATANLDGLNEGDEYLAELDYIEVVEQMKEGYEEDIPEHIKKLDKKESKKQQEEEDEEEEEEPSSDEEEKSKNDLQDDDFQPGYIGLGVAEFNKRLRARKEKEESKKKAKEEKEKENAEEDCITISDDEEVREPSCFTAAAGMNANEFKSKYRSVRTLFGEDEACYIMDAKVQGNIGRYLNHSCCPNVFVQNVFVDTHDPRFPWVAFFALSHIRAGTELTWNYNYDVGSVPGKVLYCYCGAPTCRGRLL